MSNSRSFWSNSGRWSGMVIDDLRYLCIAIWIDPGVFWLPHFLPTDVAPVTVQPLEAALECEATNCFSRESSSAGEKQLPIHCELEGTELPTMFKCRLLPALGRKVISQASNSSFYSCFIVLIAPANWVVCRAVVTLNLKSDLPLGLWLTLWCPKEA